MTRRIKMFDTYKSIKDLEKEGPFTGKKAASIVKVISSSLEQNLSDLATKNDIELLRQATKQETESLRQSIYHLEEKMCVKFEAMDTRFASMATKEDVPTSQLNVIKWLIGISITMCGTFITAMYYTQSISKSLEGSQAVRSKECTQPYMTETESRWLTNQEFERRRVYMIKYLPALQHVVQHVASK